jgi:hypothetical protein
MIGPASFSFRPISKGEALCIGGRTIVVVIADRVHAGMFRIRHPDGRLSDMTNRARARDAARSLAAAILNQKDPRISPAEAPPVARIDLRAVPAKGTG